MRTHGNVTDAITKVPVTSGFGGETMTTEVISTAQEYLTVNSEDKKSEIVNVELLLKRHPAEYVIAFLQELLDEKETFLKELVLTDRTNSRLNETIATMFRLHMAIRTIEKGIEEVRAA